MVMPNRKIWLFRADSFYVTLTWVSTFGEIMKILIIGKGAREYSIGLRLKADSTPHELFFCPGNGASTKLGTNLNIVDFIELADFAYQNKIDLSIVGGEEPLSRGIVDIFKARGLDIFGCGLKASRLESSKTYAKEILARAGVRTPEHISTTSICEADEFISELIAKGKNVVVKADGLARGKGVVLAEDEAIAKAVARDMLSGASFDGAGRRIVIEERLEGFELSFFAICDGASFVSLPPVQDYKRLKDGDSGPNTAGMGAIAPAPRASQELINKIEQDIIAPTLITLVEQGEPFKGVLFAGILVSNGEPYVLEFNVRFGDPECEVLMPLIKGELAQILLSAAKGELKEIQIQTKTHAVAVVMASKDYPYSHAMATPIKVKGEVAGGHLAYAGVQSQNGVLLATGGRVCVCVGVGDSLAQASDRAYDMCGCVSFEGAQYRSDIGAYALEHINLNNSNKLQNFTRKDR